MPWTDSRSRDEWLAEVQRRGTRIRRRRRLGFGVVGALALVLPVSVTAGVLSAGSERAVELSVAGPAPAGEPATGEVPPVAAAPPEASTTTTVDAEDRLTVTRVHPRTSPPQPDDPGVRPPSSDRSGSTSSPVLVPPPSTTVAPGVAPAPCPSSEVNVRVATDRATYASGQTVQGSSTLENRSATACLLPTRAFFRIVDGAGRDVGGFAYTMEFRFPVRAEPGRTFTSTFMWDQKDCAASACVQVSPGTYTAVADWTESGPYRGSTTFQITI